MCKNIILFCAALLITSCDYKSSKATSGNDDIYIPNSALELDEEITIEPPRTAESPPPIFYDQVDQSEKENLFIKDRKIIKKGDIRFEVESLNVAKANIDEILKQNNGYYEQEQYATHIKSISYTLTLRVPNVHFDTLIQGLENGLGMLNYKNITAEDVTEEYVDLNLRLANKQAFLEQYKTILAKARTVKDILEVQEKIRRIEEEIESRKGRIRFLEDQVNYSTLLLTITEKLEVPLVKKEGFISKLYSALSDGTTGLIDFILIMIAMWPILIIVAILIIGRKRLKKIVLRRED